jgi:hypothetical protein
MTAFDDACLKLVSPKFDDTTAQALEAWAGEVLSRATSCAMEWSHPFADDGGMDSVPHTRPVHNLVGRCKKVVFHLAPNRSADSLGHVFQIQVRCEACFPDCTCLLRVVSNPVRPCGQSAVQDPKEADKMLDAFLGESGAMNMKFDAQNPVALADIFSGKVDEFMERIVATMVAASFACDGRAPTSTN